MGAVEIVLSSIAIYYLSIFKIPSFICQKRESMRTAFFWKGEEPGKKGGYLVAWRSVCRPKDEGGVGLTPIDTFSRALLLKWFWRTEMEDPALWRSIMVQKYFVDWDGWVSHECSLPHLSSIWIGILSLRDFYICLTEIQGRVDLRNPDHKFWLMETDDYGSNNGLPPVVQKSIFFGREIGGADRKLLPTYQLKSRRYLGLTAMDAEVAFLMANQGLAQPGKLVYDPFVGTGSILIAAAHFGAMTMGADIDIRVVRDGRGPDCNVWSNFEQYGLPMPISLLRADNDLPPWRPGLGEVFDAIICDPPYGVRAGGRKSGGRKLLKGIVDPYTVPEDKKSDHIPSTAPYCLAECVHDLLDLSAKMLVMGGRLVFFYPVVREEGFTNAQLPEHPCFTMVASCEQILSLRYSRYLLTMVKTAAYTDEIAEVARSRHLEFKENHLKWLEDGNLHSAVFSPADLPQTSGKSQRDSKPKYRGKHV